MVKDLGLSGLSLWDQRLVQDVEDILADLLKLRLDLLTVVTDGRNMLVGTLRLLLLLNRRDNAPGSTSGANNVLVGNGQKVSLVNAEFSAQLDYASSALRTGMVKNITSGKGGDISYLGHLLHVCNHLIVALGLLAEPREESLAVGESA